VRLQKVIADAGVASRRKAEDMITAGRVTINGRVVRELGIRVDPAKDHVKVDGHHLKPPQPQSFIMLNKPKGVLSTLNDPQGRPTIQDLLHGISLRVFPVGRLDYDTEGLLLLTNDGEMAQALLHPRYHVPKTYLAKVKGVLSEAEIQQLERGVELEDGPTAPAMLKKAGKAEANSWMEITIYEGRKHQVKRMFDAVGHPVLRLERIRFGPLSLSGLQPGHFRFLTDREANTLRTIVKQRMSVAAESLERPEAARAPRGAEDSGSRPRPRRLQGSGLQRRRDKPRTPTTGYRRSRRGANRGAAHIPQHPRSAGHQSGRSRPNRRRRR
jgi:23S rRNA pseudouridine2605 synthase